MSWTNKLRLFDGSPLTSEVTVLASWWPPSAGIRFGQRQVA